MLSVSYEWSKRDDVLLIHYEDLVHDTLGALKRLTQKTGPLPRATDDAIEEAVQQTSFSELQGTSINGHFWQGTPGIWRQLLGAERARTIRDAHSEIFEHFGYGIDEATSCADEVFDARWREIYH